MTEYSLPKGMVVCENCGLIAIEQKNREGKSVCITCKNFEVKKGVELQQKENYPMKGHILKRCIELMSHKQKVELYETFNEGTYSDDIFNEWI